MTRSTPIAPPRPDAAHVAWMLGLLWPTPASVRVSLRWTSTGTQQVSFVPLARADQPRLLVPAVPRAAAAAAITHGRVATTPRARLVTRALAGAARLGLLNLHPHRYVVDLPPGAPDTSLLSRLEEVLGHALVPSLYLGPLRAVQKPIIQLRRPDGSPVGFVKVGVTDYTNELVRSEAKALTLLASRTARVLRTPRLLLHERWHGHEVLVQSVVPTGGPAPTPDLIAAAARDLADLGPRTSLPLNEAQWWLDLRRRIDALPSDAMSGLLRAAGTRAASRWGSTSLDLGNSHTDFTSWNMSAFAGKLHVWDWEHFTTAAPVGLDQVHFEVQDQVVVRGRMPVDVFAHGPIRPYGLVIDTSPQVLTTLYVLDLATRYLETGETTTKLARLSEWLEPTLVALVPDKGAVEP